MTRIQVLETEHSAHEGRAEHLKDASEKRLEYSEGEPEVLAEHWFQWRRQGQARRFNPFANCPLPQLVERVREGARPVRDADLEQPPSAILRFVRLKGSRTIVGNVSLHAINAMMKTAEIGYLIDEAHYGKGYATEMVGTWIDEIFDRTEIRKLVAFIAEENLASCRVAEKLGFQREGMLREQYLIEGRAVNEGVYGLLRRDWRKG